MFFILYYFNYFLNYFMFYSLLSYLIYVICFFLGPAVSELFQPVKILLFILVGLINLYYTKFHKYLVRFPDICTYVHQDSFELISDLFSIYCISHLPEFIMKLVNFSNVLKEKEIYNLSSDSSYDSTGLTNNLTTRKVSK